MSPWPAKPVPTERPPMSKGRKWTWITLSACLGLVVTEAALRAVVGLGDPPLYRPHATIEYLLVPGSYRRFGNAVFVNSAHMRSPEASAGPRALDETRIMVLGDSVVNGGSLTDQACLATELLPALASAGGTLGRLSVCNVSAGSWGPENLVEYVRGFGTFGCTDAVIVLNSGDAMDVPTFDQLGPEQPTRRPWLAMQELLQNYGARLVRQPAPAAPAGDSGERAARSLGELIDMLAQGGIRCTVLFHPTRQELERNEDGSVPSLRREAESRGVRCHSTRQRMREARESGLEPYRDDVHPSVTGQAALARSILDCVRGHEHDGAMSPGR